MKDSFIYYGVRKGRLFMTHYERQRANWSISADAAWTTRDEEAARFFAERTHGNVVQIKMTITLQK